jgi:transcriptional regulator with XRE-family HTH domain
LKQLDPDDSVACNGELLWHWRTMLSGLSQQDAAEQLDNSTTTIGKVERGKARVRLETAKKLAQGADLQLSEFVMGADATPTGVHPDYVRAGKAKGNQIRMLRRQRGYYTQTDAAEQADVSAQVWSRAESSKRIRWSNLGTIADVLQVPIPKIAEPAKKEGPILRDTKGRRL